MNNIYTKLMEDSINGKIEIIQKPSAEKNLIFKILETGKIFELTKENFVFEVKEEAVEKNIKPSVIEVTRQGNNLNNVSNVISQEPNNGLGNVCTQEIESSKTNYTLDATHGNHQHKKGIMFTLPKLLRLIEIYGKDIKIIDLID